MLTSLIRCSNNKSIKITFDPVKRDETLTHRGLDMARMDEVFAGVTITVRDDRQAYSEDRSISVGRLDGRMVVVVWTPRDGRTRIISLRKANAREQKPMKVAWTDPDDAPDLSTPEWRSKLDAAPAKRGRPVSANPKVSTTVRFDADVLAALRAGGKGWQTRANALLRESLGL